MALVVLCGSLWTPACYDDRSVDEHRVRTSVANYNNALRIAYNKENQQQLADAATQDEQERVGVLMSGMAMQGLTLDCRQESFVVESVDVSGPTDAQLVANEVWWYRHLRRGSQTVQRPPKRVRYRLRYHLRKDQDRWLVDRVEEIEVAEVASD